MSLGIDVAEAIASAVKSQSAIPNLSVSPTAPKGVPNTPSFAIGLPKYSFPDPYEPQDHLGEDDWSLEFMAILLVSLTDADKSQRQAAAFIEEIIQILKEDPSLGGTVAESSLISAEPRAVKGEEGQPADYLEYRCSIQVVAFK